MLRLLFEKRGNAVWISHLDLMRVFQRAFQRARLPLKHTNGFNPRPSVSIALPLSVGIESKCELLDFELDGPPVAFSELRERLNASLIPGVRVREVYEGIQKPRDIAFLDCILNLEYDDGIPAGAVEKMGKLFEEPELLVTKKNKNGVSEQNIIPMIREIAFREIGSQEIQICARICCQNPTLNPMQLSGAIAKYLPEMIPDYVACCREEIYTQNEEIFR